MGSNTVIMGSFPLRPAVSFFLLIITLRSRARVPCGTGMTRSTYSRV